MVSQACGSFLILFVIGLVWGILFLFWKKGISLLVYFKIKDSIIAKLRKKIILGTRSSKTNLFLVLFLAPFLLYLTSIFIPDITGKGSEICGLVLAQIPIIAVFIQPVFEEILLRCFILGGMLLLIEILSISLFKNKIILKNSLIFLAILLQAILFWFAHYPGINTFDPRLIVGLTTGVLYYYFRDLKQVILFHILWNLSLILFY